MCIAKIAEIDVNMKNETPKYFLKDIATIVAGQSPESKYYNTDGEGLPFFQGKADFGALYPKVRTYCARPTKIAEKDDILLSVRAPVGPTNLSPEKVCIGRGLTAIRPGKEVRLKYLLYFFRYYEAQLQRSGTGTTFKAITQNVVKNIEVPVPAIEEQERIVSKIEELFSKLDASVAELQAAKEKLKVYRQTVLYRAFQNLADTITMDKIADMIDPQPSHRTPPEVMNGVPYIGVGDIDYSVRKIKFGEARKVSPIVLQEHQERYTLHKGDFIMGKIGTIGKPFIVPLPQNYTLSANVILIQPNCETVLPEFLYWQFCSPLVTQQLTAGAAATSQPAFGIKKARLLSIRMCGIDQQRRIVSEIEDSMSICDSIEQTIDTSLQRAEALRQSILKQAFEGGL